MAKNTFYCPNCFELIRSKDIVYFCDHHKQAVPRTAGVLENIGLLSPPKVIPCGCGSNKNTFATRLRCPACNLDLPLSLNELSDVSIAVVGGRGVGKSHYIALLVHCIRKLHREFGWNLIPLVESTITNYNNNFYNPLFLQQVPLRSTNMGRSVPLMYSMRLKKRHKRITLSFFDTAGESLEKEENMLYFETINRYIFNSSGIICLMDPLQLGPVRNELMQFMRTEDLPTREETSTGTIINRLGNVIRRGYEIQGKGISVKKKIHIPIAVAFSKVDAMRVPDGNQTQLLFEDSNVIYRDSGHCGFFNKDEFQSISDYLQDWLIVADDTHDITQQLDEFQNKAFFAFSSLGCNPQRTQKLEHVPQPYRVEDPFLWLLWRNKIL